MYACVFISHKLNSDLRPLLSSPPKNSWAAIGRGCICSSRSPLCIDKPGPSCYDTASWSCWKTGKICCGRPTHCFSTRAIGCPPLRGRSFSLGARWLECRQHRRWVHPSVQGCCLQAISGDFARTPRFFSGCFRSIPRHAFRLHPRSLHFPVVLNNPSVLCLGTEFSQFL